jgi:hypothetical protein
VAIRRTPEIIAVNGLGIVGVGEDFAVPILREN